MPKQPADSTNQYSGIPQVPPPIMEHQDPYAGTQPPASAVGAMPMEGIEFEKRTKPQMSIYFFCR